MSAQNQSNPFQQLHKNLVGHTIADGRLEFVGILGLGAYGVVYLARDLTHYLHQTPFASTSSKHSQAHLNQAAALASAHGSSACGYYAVKCLSKVGLDERQRKFQRREITLHTMASSHPSICTLHRVIDEPQDPCVYVVLDYCPDGDLFSMITEAGRYTVSQAQPTEVVHQHTSSCRKGKSVEGDIYCQDEEDLYDEAEAAFEEYHVARTDMDSLIRSVFVQILDAVQFCHSYGIFHRDLKPENILCLAGGSKVVLTDFGLATGEKTSSDFGCGSTFYMGPECQGGINTRLSDYNTEANDVWSLGVILVNLICGRNPWKQACPADETFREYLRNPEFLKEILPISDDINTLLKAIFTVRPEKRISVTQLRQMMRVIPRFTASLQELAERQENTRIAAAHAQAARLAHKVAAAHSSKDLKQRAHINAREAACKAARAAQWEAAASAEAAQLEQLSQPSPPLQLSLVPEEGEYEHGQSESDFSDSDSSYSESSDCSVQVPIQDTCNCQIISETVIPSHQSPSPATGHVDWSQHPIAATPARTRKAIVSDSTGADEERAYQNAVAASNGQWSKEEEDIQMEGPSTPCARPIRTDGVNIDDQSSSPHSTISGCESDMDMTPDSSSSRSGSGGSRRSSASYTGLPPTPEFNGQDLVHAFQQHGGKKSSSSDFGMDGLALDSEIPEASLGSAFVEQPSLSQPSPLQVEGTLKIQHGQSQEAPVTRWIRRGLEESMEMDQSTSTSSKSQASDDGSIGTSTGGRRGSGYSILSLNSNWDSDALAHPHDIFESSDYSSPYLTSRRQQQLANTPVKQDRFNSMPSRRSPRTSPSASTNPYNNNNHSSTRRNKNLPPSPFLQQGVHQF